jgi:hypothetical protein
MKLINQCLTYEEASILCQRISVIEQTRPRVKEILEVEGSLRDNKLANRVASELLQGNVILIDKTAMKVSNHSSDAFQQLTLEPVEIEPLNIYYTTASADILAGPIDLDKLETLLPTLDIYQTSLFYNGLITWRSLAELRQKYLTPE